jgi:cobalt-zinc-cadmium efflux system protein
MHQSAGGNQTHGDRRLALAVGVNVLLTVVQVIAGLASGSLSLVADALHNLSDAGSILLALVARRIGRRPADEQMTYGYKRAEIVGTLINTTVLVVVGLYLIYEAIVRLFSPEPIDGWIVVIVAAVALVIDTVTAILTWSMSRGSMNIRAAFVHNVADALGSVGVMIAGSLILLFDLALADTIATLLIAAYVLWQSVGLLKESVQVLMDGVPAGISVHDIAASISAIDEVVAVHHLHVRSLSEHDAALECHVTTELAAIQDLRALRERIGTLLRERHSIHHATVEFEPPGSCRDEPNGLIADE